MSDVSGFAKILDKDRIDGFRFDSVESVVAQWIMMKANFPASQIVLGLTAYGHSFNVSGSQPVGSSDAPSDMGTEPCGNPYAISSVFTFERLVSEGFLDLNGNANYNYAIDECSGTPFVYDEDTHAMVSYDDAKSFALMGTDNGLAWFALWDATGDYNDTLLGLHSAMGITDCVNPRSKRDSAADSLL
ncbi:Glycoside hydrolase family 18 protein [Mycena sanguinolenta]|uniref:Glycoside hydrolase family 18 protein n=1 Tax=Mycena sanguinolenta TaxID=230812 RepID=A0A8H6YHU4_9AGAR|nr:Glycoside hydrolase family 18 protein [Mycena sanguinolenta]